MYKVLFVCTGNICRSSTAEGVFRHLVEAAGLDAKIAAESAGTHGYHVGEPPDPRTIAAAAKRGFDLEAQRARRVTAKDFQAFDLILAMDRGHLAQLEAMRPHGAKAELKLFLDYHPNRRGDVPDPYYSGEDVFQLVLDLSEAGSKGLLAHVRRVLGA